MTAKSKCCLINKIIIERVAFYLRRLLAFIIFFLVLFQKKHTRALIIFLNHTHKKMSSWSSSWSVTSVNHDEKIIINGASDGGGWSIEALLDLYHTVPRVKENVDTRYKKRLATHGSTMTLEQQLVRYVNGGSGVPYSRHPDAIALLEKRGSKYCSQENGNLIVMTIPAFHVYRVMTCERLESLEVLYDTGRVVDDLWELLQQAYHNTNDEKLFEKLPECAKRYMEEKLEDKKRQRKMRFSSSLSSSSSSSPSHQKHDEIPSTRPSGQRSDQPSVYKEAHQHHQPLRQRKDCYHQKKRYFIKSRSMQKNE